MAPILPRIRERPLLVRNTGDSIRQLGFGSYTGLGTSGQGSRWASEGQRFHGPGYGVLLVENSTGNSCKSHGFTLTYMMVKGKGSLPGQRIQGNKELVVIRNLSPIFCEILYPFLGLPVSGHSSLILVFRQPTSPYRRADRSGDGLWEVPEWPSSVAEDQCNWKGPSVLCTLCSCCCSIFCWQILKTVLVLSTSSRVARKEHVLWTLTFQCASLGVRCNY